MTLRIPISLATWFANIPAAPPKATIENSRGSNPFLTEANRIPSAMELETTRKMPAAASVTDSSRGSATFSRMAVSDKLESSDTRPPKKEAGSSSPRTKAASVTVGSSPPIP